MDHFYPFPTDSLIYCSSIDELRSEERLGIASLLVTPRLEFMPWSRREEASKVGLLRAIMADDLAQTKLNVPQYASSFNLLEKLDPTCPARDMLRLIQSMFERFVTFRSTASSSSHQDQDAEAAMLEDAQGLSDFVDKEWQQSCPIRALQPLGAFISDALQGVLDLSETFSEDESTLASLFEFFQPRVVVFDSPRTLPRSLLSLVRV